MKRLLAKLQLPLIAGFLLAVGLFFLYLLGQVDTLRCRRAVEGQPEVRCTLSTTWLRLADLREQELGSLRGASIQDSCDSEGCTYRVFLNTDRGGTALGNMYTSDLRGQQEIAARINAFLAVDSPPGLEIASGGGWVLIIPLLILLAGLFLAVRSVRKLMNPTE